MKFLLWARRGHRLFIGGPRCIGEYIRQVYSAHGERQFEYHFMSEQVYEQTFNVVVCSA